MGNGQIRQFSQTVQNGPWTSATLDTLVQSANANGATEFVYRASEADEVHRFSATGQLLSHTQRNGWTMNYKYNAAGQSQQVSNQFGRTLQLAYNTNGLLSQVTTPDAQSINYEYDSSSRLSVVRYPGTVSKTYLYENASFPTALTGVTDETGTRLATYSYDAQGRAIETVHAGTANRYQVSYPASSGAPTVVTDPLGTARSYNYATSLGQLAVTGADKPSGQGLSAAASRDQNSDGLITRSNDFNGIATLYAWDSNRRLPTYIFRGYDSSVLQGTKIIWHATLRLPLQISLQDRNNRVYKKTDYTYDAAGNKLTQVETDTTGNPSPSNGQVRTWAWTYHTTAPLTGLVATSTDPRGKVTSYTYDTAGNVAGMTNPLGHVSSYLYDGAGRVTRSTEPNGLQTSMAYDPRGRLTQTVRGASLAVPLQQKTVYTYTAPGQVASATLPNGYQVSYSYDAAQRLVGALDNRGNRISYTLDGMGNRVREEVKDASNQIALVTRRVINSLNRVSAIQGSGSTAPGAGTALGQTTLGYDANGEPVQSTDPLGQTTRQTLDALRRPTSTQLPDNAQASVAYNALNQITQAIDPKAVATVYVKNAWGEILTETSPDSGSTSTTRDTAGNVLTSLDARGNTTQYQYDNAGRVSQITQADGKLQLFSYDGTAAGNQLGTLREITDTSGTTSYERDAFGRVTKKTQTVNDNPASPTTLTTRYM